MSFDPFGPSPTQRKLQSSEHEERLGQQMRDESELDNLKDEIGRNLKGEAVTLPWRTGRALKSAGMTADGEPLTPLAALDLHATVPPGLANRLAAELQRAALLDNVSEGTLDRAEAMGVPLLIQETQQEADDRCARDEQRAAEPEANS